MKLFIVIDYQNDFVDGALGFEKALGLDEKIAEKVLECLEQGYEIIATKDTHFENYLETLEGKNLPIPHCIKGTSGHDFYGETAKALEKVNPYIIEKTTFGINPFEFNKKYFEEFENVEQIEFAGIVTNMCVLSNVVIFKAKYQEAEIIVHEDMCASFSDELHDKTLDVLEGMQVVVKRV